MGTRVFSSESAEMNAVHVFLTKHKHWILKKKYSHITKWLNVSETRMKYIIKKHLNFALYCSRLHRFTTINMLGFSTYYFFFIILTYKLSLWELQMVTLKCQEMAGNVPFH
jgi:hypothetical protein